ncbi:uncharacterized protein [Dysidea avara]|uniref:uncharacterized protein isoform X3 n=1 Tax=Dysidea avara TaxID=196820 RepID=UPI00332AEA26
MLLFAIAAITLSVLEGSATSCAPDIQSARVFQRVVGRPLSLPCPLHHCNGEQVLEHYNMTTLKYDIIDDGPHHLIGYDDEGSHRCWQRCNTTNQQYCYFIVQVIPEMAEAKINFPSAVLTKPYTGTCDAAGDPRPIVNASMNTEHCPHSIFITKTTVFTAQAALRIPSVTTGCNGEIFSCTICQQGTCQEVKVMINVTEDTTQNTSPESSPTITTTNDTHNGRNDVVNTTNRTSSNKNHLMLSLIVTLSVISYVL